MRVDNGWKSDIVGTVKSQWKLPRNQCKKVILPGMWLDQEDNVHFSIKDLLTEFSLPDTPANRDRLKEMVKDMVRQVASEQNKRGVIIERERAD